MRSAILLVAIFAVVLGPNQARAQANLAALLTDPKFAPFITAIIAGAPACLTDPAVLGGDFDVLSCPGLNNLLEDYLNKVEDPVITCEAACNTAFDTLSEDCYTQLRAAVEGSNEAYAPLATEFFKTCEGDAAAGPTPSPSATPSVPPAAPTDGSKPAENWAMALAPQVAIILLINAVLFAL